MPVQFDPISGAYRYIASAATRADALDSEVQRHDVQPQLVADVERTVRTAARSLGIDAPKVRWLPATVPGVRGVVFEPSEIWVKVQPPAMARQTSLHELRHAWGLQGGRYEALGLWTMPERQADADRFAASWQPVDEIKAADGAVLSHKTVAADLQVKANGTDWELSGWASTFSPPNAPASEADSYGDLILAGAFSESIKTRPTKLLAEHAVPIGAQIEIKETSKGLWGRWSIIPTQAGEDTRKLILGGVVNQLSIGYALKDAVTRADGIRLIKQVDLFEVSAVSLAANQHATITAVKRAAVPPPTERLDLHAELLRRRAAQVRRVREGRRVSGVRA